LSIVGPRFSGKSVVLNALKASIEKCDTQYAAVILWDLGHLTPNSDNSFLSVMRGLIAQSLAGKHQEIADELRNVDEGDYPSIRELFEYMSHSNIHILMLWDGFDKPLASGKLTRNLWDQLRELASEPSLRLVTASRRKLIDLIRSEESATSDFWGIFDPTPVKLATFDDQDCGEILSMLTGHQLDRGALTELANWTANYPPLFLDLLNEIASSCAPGQVDNEQVNQAASAITERVEPILHSAWAECPIEAKDLYLDLAASRGIPESEVNLADANWLLERGMACKRGNQIQVACRFLQNFLQANSQYGSNMSHLFGSPSAYNANIRGVLERRLGLVNSSERILTRLISLCISDIPDHPETCLGNLTSIEDAVLAAVCAYEFGPDRIFPGEVYDQLHWVDATNKIVKRLRDLRDRPIPGDRLIRLQILRLITGSAQGFQTISRFANKDIYVLIDAIHSFRNRTEHSDGDHISLGVAVAALMICIELLACIERAKLEDI
jgi:hypothetical protein